MLRGSITYPREVPATLIVRLATGEEWEAGEADVAKFAKPVVEQAYFRFAAALTDALLDNGVDLGHGQDLSNSALNAIRYLAEVTVYFGWDAKEHMSVADLAHIAGLEHGLRALFASQTVEWDMHPVTPLLFDNTNEFEHTPLLQRSHHVVEAQRLLDIVEDQ